MRLAIGRFRHRAPTHATFDGAAAFARLDNQNTKLIFHDDDPVSTVLVLESSQTSRARSTMTNGKPDGSTVDDYATMCFAGVIPALLTDDPSRAFVIGWPAIRNSRRSAHAPNVRTSAPAWHVAAPRPSRSCSHTS